MGINKDFRLPRRQIKWDGQDVCEVHGLAPADLAVVMRENAGDMERIVESWSKDKALASIADDPTASEEIAEKITQNSAVLFGSLINLVPDLAAKLIALAADDADMWEHVRDNYVVPLQFDILCEIAQMTFVNQDGFKKFLGNVLALAGNVGGGQRRIAP